MLRMISCLQAFDPLRCSYDPTLFYDRVQSVKVGGFHLCDKRNPSIGGWTGSARFSEGVRFWLWRSRYRLGVSSGTDLSELLHDCRLALDEYSDRNNLFYRFQLLIASSVAPEYNRKLPLNGMSHCVDHIILMRYDYATSNSIANLLFQRYNLFESVYS